MKRIREVTQTLKVRIAQSAFLQKLHTVPHTLFGQSDTNRMQKTMRTSGAGFTIIELLVVVAVIGILSAIIITSFTEVRQKSRDTERLSDVREIEKALNLYYNSHGQFPISVSELVITSNDALSLALENDGVISNAPIDPLHSTYTYRYQTNALGTTFILSFCLEGNYIDNFSQGCSNTITP